MSNFDVLIPNKSGIDTTLDKIVGSFCAEYYLYSFLFI